MHLFTYHRAADVPDALASLQGQAAFLAGGTTLVDLMKLEVMTPATLIDITGIDELAGFDTSDDPLRFGALARMSYFGGFASAQPGFCDECREEYPSKTLFDAEVSYRFAPQVGFAIGARNIFDVYPGLASEQNSFLIYPWAAASP